MAERDKFSDFDDDLGTPTIPIAAPKEEAKKPEPGPPEEIERLRRERNEANAQRHEAISAMLEGARATAAQAPAEPQPPGEDFLTKNLPDDVDPDVLALLRPVLKAHKEIIEQDFSDRFGPIAETVEREQNLKMIEERVPGFSKDMLPEIGALYQKLSPDEREEYDNRLGVEVLALRAQLAKRGRSDMSGMAHSAPPGGPPEIKGEPTEEDVWDMPEDEFEAYLHSVKMGGSR